MNSIAIKSYAKINISLDVKAKREDGYHELDSIMVPLELHDSIRISKLQKATDDFITVDDFSLGVIEYNLASFATDCMRSKYNFKQNFRIFIHKNIPMQAGLGGGSSNAAFTLIALNKLMKLNASDEELLELAKPLGADVPFFITCKPVRCGGIGEKMTPITIKNDYYALLVKPKKGCSTREIFAAFDSMDIKTGNMENVVKALAEGDDELLANSIYNSLENPAISLVEDIQVIKDKMKELGFKIVLMSGSGSSVFTLSTDKNLIKKASLAFEDDYWTETTKIIKNR